MEITPDHLTTIAKIVGSGWVLQEVAKPSLERLGKSVENFFLGPRSEHAATILKDAAEMVTGAATAPVPVPGRIIMPILEFGSWEDEPDMQKRWSALLANAAVSSPTSAKVLPGFSDVLRQLTPVHAQFLDVMYDDFRKAAHDGHYMDSDDIRDILAARTKRHMSESEFELIASDLQRLLLLEPKRWSTTRSGGGEVDGVTLTKTRLTLFGTFFVKACRPPVPYSSYD